MAITANSRHNRQNSNCGYTRWIPITNFSAVDDKPVFGGTDFHGSVINVCRVKLNETLVIPGKAKLEQRKCHFAFNGKENELEDFEVLVNPDEGFLIWEKYIGIIPSNAIKAGVKDKNDLFIGRCFLKGKFVSNETFATDSTGMIHVAGSDASFVTVVFGGVEFKCRKDMKILICGLTQSQDGDPKYDENIKQKAHRVLNSPLPVISVVIIVFATSVTILLVIAISICLYRNFFTATPRGLSFRLRTNYGDRPKVDREIVESYADAANTESVYERVNDYASIDDYRKRQSDDYIEITSSGNYYSNMNETQ